MITSLDWVVKKFVDLHLLHNFFLEYIKDLRIIVIKKKSSNI
jgi:hypothetical protein